MKIVICASMSAAKKVIEIQKALTNMGNEVVIPKNIDKYADGTLAPEDSQESTQNKINDDLIRAYYREIQNSDAVLAVNDDKNGIANYIGGNTFLEIGFAHVLNKKIYLLNDIPDVSYSDEIIAMNPIVIFGLLSKIR